MFRPVFQSSTLSVRRQATTTFGIRAATVTATATPVVGNNPTSTSTTTIRSASTLTTQLHNNKINNSYGVIAVVTPQSSSSSSSSHYRRWFSDAGTKPGASSDGGEDNENNKDKDDNDDDAVAEEDGADSTDDDDDAADASEIEIKKLKNELSDMKNQLLRSLAEQENIRSIARRDVQTAKDFSTKSFAKSLLEVADNLDRALESVNNDTDTSDTTTDTANKDNTNSTLKSFVEGIELTNIGLIKSLQSNGVEAFCELPGDEFNPDKHQALMEYVDPTSKLLPGTIGVVMKKGYTLNKRVLRPAEVGVIKK